MNNGRVHIAALLIGCACISFSCRQNDSSAAKPVELSADLTSEESSQESTNQDPPYTDAQMALLAAYPDFISDIKENKIIFVDGTAMVYNDGKEKDFDTMLDESDPEDMFFVKYRNNGQPPEYLSDAGRSRCESLFRKMYGDNEQAVRRNLTNVSWFGKKVQFTSVNGAADQLKKVAAEIAEHPELLKWVDCSGTFYWRPVRGAKRLSAHSYGIAIDIAVKFSDYWLWKNPKAKETDRIAYVNRIPLELVEIFEKHGFIWGGAWYHYDTMHFEYRPEILAFSNPQ